MIYQKSLDSRPKLTSTLKITTKTMDANNLMLTTAIDALQNLNPHLKVKDERTKHPSKRNRREDVIIGAPNTTLQNVGVSNSTGIKGSNKLTAELQHHQSVVRPTKNSVLGGFFDYIKPQHSMRNIIEHVLGAKIDFTA
tara:strand:- start:88 stop:504 length:417 start_codon:yes stop_codon:yes gene_type:complete